MASSSPLLDLPTELRLVILYHYFAASMPARDDPPSTSGRMIDHPRKTCDSFLRGMKILHVCQQLREEALKPFEDALRKETKVRLHAMGMVCPPTHYGNRHHQNASFRQAVRLHAAVVQAWQIWHTRGTGAAVDRPVGIKQGGLVYLFTVAEEERL
nr:hypothetical protein B0A51_03673 [Rachicladosporium sp. CCFEE 5018]